MSTFSKVLADIKTLAENFVSGCASFCDALVTNIEAQGGPLLLSIVTDAVTAAETVGGTGAAKLAAAKTQIISDLASKGITAAENTINGAIEAAVASLPANNASTTVAAGAATSN